jgi:hypothetical protein
VILAVCVQAATAWESKRPLTVSLNENVLTLLGTGPSRLTALTVRQDLCDMVSIAKSDGRISQSERSLILSEARGVLKPEEYASFRQSFEQLSPPLPVEVKHSMKFAKKKGSSASKTKNSELANNSPAPPDATGKRKPTGVVNTLARLVSWNSDETAPKAKSAASMVIPAGAIMPDPVVLTGQVQ